MRNCDFKGKPAWIPPEARRPAAGEWDGAGPVPETWAKSWTVVEPDVYTSPVTGESRIEDCCIALLYARHVKPGVAAYGRMAGKAFTWGHDTKDKLRPMLFRTRKDAESFARAYVDWTYDNGWFEHDGLRRYDEKNPLMSEQRDRKTGIWYRMVKAIPIREYKVFSKTNEHRREVAAVRGALPQEKPVPSGAGKPKRGPGRPPGHEGYVQSRFTATFDPDCLEREANAGWHGLRDSATGKWLRFGGTGFSLVAGETECTAFPDRIAAADVMCRIEQRAWAAEVAGLRVRVEKLSEPAQKAFSERKSSAPAA